MTLLIGLISIFIVFQPTYKNKNESNFVPDAIKLYVLDLRNAIIKEQIPESYIDKYDNLIFKIVSEADDAYFLEHALPTTPTWQRKNVIALCSKQFNIIYIREVMLKTQKDVEIQELIDHEVGHCVFGRIHSNETMSFKQTILPKSIMTSHHVTMEDPDEIVLLKSRYIVFFYKHEELKTYYRKELFDPNKFNEDATIP